MSKPISQCRAQVSMTLDQIVTIDKAFTDVEILKAQNAMLSMQLATAQLDLRVITDTLYVTNSGEDVWVESNIKNKPEVWEDFILTVKRNKHENV